MGETHRLLKTIYRNDVPGRMFLAVQNLLSFKIKVVSPGLK